MRRRIMIRLPFRPLLLDIPVGRAVQFAPGRVLGIVDVVVGLVDQVVEFVEKRPLPAPLVFRRKPHDLATGQAGAGEAHG